jgi:GDP-L-fucose synthase
MLQVYSGDVQVNVGSGEDMTIEALARLVIDVVGFKGALEKDLSKPDGTPRKLMQAGRLRGLGWTPKIGMREGLEDAYAWFQGHQSEVKQ